MKVLHVLPSLSKRLGGPTFLTLSLARELIKLGVEVEIVSTNDDGKNTLDLPIGVLTEYEGVQCRVFKRSFLRRHEYIVSCGMAAWLWKNVLNYDVLDIHYLFTFSASASAASAIYRNIPYTVRSMGELSPWAISQNRIIKSIHFSLFEKWILSHSKVIQCTSLGEKEDVRNATLDSSLEVLPLGVILPQLTPSSRRVGRSRLGFSEEDFVLLFLSRLHKKKRPEFAIDLLSILPENTKLLFAGEGSTDYENSLKDRCLARGVQERVKFLGHVDRIEGEELRQLSDLFVLPSYSENFSLAVAESLASGLPVAITPEIQISPEVGSALGGIVLEASLDKWGIAIQELINKRELLAEMASNARALAEKEYSITNAAQKLISLYERIRSTTYS